MVKSKAKNAITVAPPTPIKVLIKQVETCQQEQGVKGITPLKSLDHRGLKRGKESLLSLKPL